jgi:asparagine synthase (glutamine-hydrolysing)
VCGIAGIFDFEARGVDEVGLRAMAQAIRHRGPDDEGWFTNSRVGLTNLRLAIIDVSPGGHQPMQTADGRLTLVYNGELYNFRELALELQRAGHEFQSRSDTEVVLHAYEEWGVGCLDRFDGMFAFAVWDERTQELVLARDRFGVKPLYYGTSDGRLLFGSEVKAIVAAGYRPSLDAAAVAEYFTFQNIFSERTLFDGIRVLPAGHYMRVGEHGAETRQYWDLRLEPDESVGRDEWVELIATAFEGGVIRQLVGDVHLGSYLSGGMDSASIAAVARRSIPRLMTFTGGFDMRSVSGLELVFDEREDAEAVASELRTEHYEMVIHAGDMQWVLPELIWHLEDLRVGMSYQNHYIARLASKFVKVVLAGTGGDELFGGYPWRYDLVAGLDGGAFEAAHYGYWTRLVPDADKSSFFAPGLLEAAREHPPLEAYRAAIAPADGLDPVSKALYFEAKTFLHGLLIVEDKVSMAHSLESRVPFLDNALVDVARRIPPSLKHGGGVGKRLLREAMREFLPAAILDKPKQGFSPPDQAWYRGESMSYIKQILLDPRTLGRGYFQEPYVRRVLDEHVDGKVNHRLLIWSLLAFEWWNRLYIDGDATTRHGAWHLSRASAVAAMS